MCCTHGTSFGKQQFTAKLEVISHPHNPPHTFSSLFFFPQMQRILRKTWCLRLGVANYGPMSKSSYLFFVNNFFLNTAILVHLSIILSCSCATLVVVAVTETVWPTSLKYLLLGYFQKFFADLCLRLLMEGTWALDYVKPLKFLVYLLA